MRLSTRASSELAMPLALALAGCFSPQGSDGSTGPSTSGPPAETSTGVSTLEGETTASETTGIPATTGTGPTETTDDPTTGAVTTGSSTASTASTTTDTSTTGAPGVCGDGIIDTPIEQCDDGKSNDMNAPCTPVCQVNVCGDDFACMACGEECDDGNATAGDGCSSQCMQEHLFVFVTSTPKVGEQIGGVVGADQFCNELASGHFNPKRKFIAWMTDGKPMLERVGLSTLPFVAPVSLTKIATGTDGLLLSKLEAPILTTETGTILTPLETCTETSSVWTGVKNGGLLDANTCMNWSAMGTIGLAGALGDTSQKWTEACALDCGFALPLYCVETIL